MNRECGAVFRQSLRDFPCPVTLGKNTPDFGLQRFKQGLRFVPLDNEGFTLRGDKRRLLYKGRRRSHRFTILGDTAFEYDCILEKEPESNFISLLIQGAENFDFFRQPDFVPDPFLKGSYAVYKKDTLIGEGTGKLCHIHRPEIIDARGRRCWGDLAVAGNELHITIPEWFLSTAKYPVIVDPTIGTATIGNQYMVYEDDGDDSYWHPFQVEAGMVVNRFLVPEIVSGTCTAYFYANSDEGENESGGRAVLYSDNNNVPQNRKCKNENYIDLRVEKANKTKGWRSGTFAPVENLSGGSYIWFGCNAEYFWFPRYDYGAKCYFGDWENYSIGIPNTFKHYGEDWFFDYKLSMYFEFTSLSQNYVRILTQGVKLTDNQKLIAGYKRNTSQTAGVNSAASRFETLVRKCVMSAGNFISLGCWGVFFRGLLVNAGNTAEITHKADYFRFHSDTVQAAGALFRGLLLFIRIVTTVFVRDYLLGQFLKAREELVLKSPICREITIESRID